MTRALPSVLGCRGGCSPPGGQWDLATETEAEHGSTLLRGRPEPTRLAVPAEP